MGVLDRLKKQGAQLLNDADNAVNAAGDKLSKAASSVQKHASDTFQAGKAEVKKAVVVVEKHVDATYQAGKKEVKDAAVVVEKHVTDTYQAGKKEVKDAAVAVEKHVTDTFQAGKKEVKDVAVAVEKHVDATYQAGKKEVKDVAVVVGKHVDATYQEGKKEVKDTVAAARRELTAAREEFLALLPRGTEHRERDAAAFDQNTAELRNAAGSYRRASDQLATLPQGDPRRAQAQRDLQGAEQTLAKYGYTGKTVPKPGALWLDPKFNTPGAVAASQHPTGTPVTAPPDPMAALFQRPGKTLDLVGPDGKVQKVGSPQEYQQVVAANRAAAGMPVKDGQPIGVQLNLQGGGGTGKRYASMMGELINQGVVPTSVSGTSAGSIAAALIAGGANPDQMQKLVTDPALAGLLDRHYWFGDSGGGLADGKKAYDWVDQHLRELTGIKDRPVTFADLKMPLQIVATRWTDSDPGSADMKTTQGRTFVFSQETTPDTPVALAVRASMSIPAMFDPVKMQDPITGRRVELVDGGMVDNLPMNYGRNNLPQLGVSLLQQVNAHPADAQGAGTLPETKELSGQWLKSVASQASDFNSKTGRTLDDYNNRIHPQAGQFMLAVPVWNLRNPAERNEITGFAPQAGVDDRLDAQTQDVTRRFLQQNLGALRVPGARATNLAAAEVGTTRFSNQPVTVKGVAYSASYTGGDSLLLTRPGDKPRAVPLGQKVIEALYQDGKNFGNLGAGLTYAIEQQQRSGVQKRLDGVSSLEALAGFNPELEKVSPPPAPKRFSPLVSPGLAASESLYRTVKELGSPGLQPAPEKK